MIGWDIARTMRSGTSVGPGMERNGRPDMTRPLYAEAVNPARRAVLLAVAEELAGAALDGFDAGRFRQDFEAPATLDAFREDLAAAHALGIGRFPALTLRRTEDSGRAILLLGWRPYAVLRAALA